MRANVSISENGWSLTVPVILPKNLAFRSNEVAMGGVDPGAGATDNTAAADDAGASATFASGRVLSILCATSIRITALPEVGIAATLP